MATRVTPAEVQVLIATTLSVSEIQAFIDTANLLVTETLGSKTSLSEARRTEIERYLSAHFVAMREETGGVIKTRTGESWDDYALKVGQGLMQTRYGQQAAMLDSTGTLKRIAMGTVASFKTWPRKLIPTDSEA